MAIADIGIFSALKGKMAWHQTRQTLLAENVANAETPDYRGRDLKEYNFKEHMDGAGSRSLATAKTHASHIAVQSPGGLGGFSAKDLNSFEITPEGNGVVLEDEMMKVAANQIDFQAATMLYSRSLKLIRTAMGR